MAHSHLLNLKHEIMTKNDLWPTCFEYAHFLDLAVSKFKITIDEARERYGLYTYGEWIKMLA